MRACYPGSFDPLTVAHVSIARAVLAQCPGVGDVDFVLSRSALGKEAGHAQSLRARVAAIEAAGFRAVVTDARLVADVAAGYGALVVGADKWAQLLDVSFYGGSVAARSDALARLPRVLAIAPRAGWSSPAVDDVVAAVGSDCSVVELVLPAWIGAVSSSAVRSGEAPAEWHFRPPPPRRAGGDSGQTRQSPE